jgi:hypothetical protein
MSVEELQSGFLKLVKRLYSAEETRARRTAFWRLLPRSRRTPLLEAAVT